MTFPSIDIQGSIISSDLLCKIRSEQATHQHGKDFQPGFTDAKLKDEISLAWQEGQAARKQVPACKPACADAGIPEPL